MMQDKLPPHPPALKPCRGNLNQKAVVIGVAITFLLLACFPEAVATWVEAISPGCRFRQWTGIACPGCGGTRAVCSLLEGDIVAACGHNMLLPVVALILLVEYLRLAKNAFWGGYDWQGYGWYRKMLCGFVKITLLWFVLRNIWGI